MRRRAAHPDRLLPCITGEARESCEEKERDCGACGDKYDNESTGFSESCEATVGFQMADSVNPVDSLSSLGTDRYDSESMGFIESYEATVGSSMKDSVNRVDSWSYP